MAKFSLTKGRLIFIVDLILLPVFALVVYTGLKLHEVGHENNYSHNIWEYWAHFHIIISVISLLVGWLHIKAHWNWYTGLFKKGIGKRSKVTLSLSMLFFILIITGIILIFFIEGGNSPVGLWHYKLGLIMTVLLLVHFISRFSILMKGLRRNR